MFSLGPISRHSAVYAAGTLGAACLALWLVALAAPAGAIEVEQVDDFQDGTTQGWKHGRQSSNPPTNIASGGPSGAGDRFLEVTSTGVGFAGSRFVALNQEQWTGDYLVAQVAAIATWVNNTGDTELQLRVALSGGGGKFSSVDAIVVPAGSGWTGVEFPVGPDDLSCALDESCSGTSEDSLASVTELRILSAAAGPQWRGDKMPAKAGFDEIVALAGTANSARVILPRLDDALLPLAKFELEMAIDLEESPRRLRSAAVRRL